MNQPNAQTYKDRIKVSGKYEAATIQGKLSVAGTRFHFIGAGGVGMSGLAQLMMKNEAIVTGSDETLSDIINGLRQRGAEITIGHRARNLKVGTN